MERPEPSDVVLAPDGPSNRRLVDAAGARSDESFQSLHSDDYRPDKLATVIVPGISFGRFTLGESITTVVQALASNVTTYGRVGVDCDVRGAATPISLTIESLSVRLVFHPRRQTLEHIEINDLARCGDLYYRGRVLCGGLVLPTFVQLYDVLGPTFHGTMDEHGVYSLKYPGLLIFFKIPVAFRSMYTDESNEHPVALPDGSTPVATRMIVEFAKAGEASRAAVGMGMTLWGADCVVDPERGISFPTMDVALSFGMCPQDVVQTLGGPSSIFPKEDDRLLIHNPRLNVAHTTKRAPSCFYCYPHHGIDILFDAVKQELTKAVLFNSVPPHEAFLRYHRCHYSLFMDNEGRWRAGTAGTAENLLHVDNCTRWEDISAWCDRHGLRAPTPLLASTQYGAVKIYSFEGIILSVLSCSGCIASVTVFHVPHSSGVGLPKCSGACSAHTISGAQLPRQMLPDRVDPQPVANAKPHDRPIQENFASPVEEAPVERHTLPDRVDPQLVANAKPHDHPIQENSASPVEEAPVEVRVEDKLEEAPQEVPPALEALPPSPPTSEPLLAEHPEPPVEHHAPVDEEGPPPPPADEALPALVTDEEPAVSKEPLTATQRKKLKKLQKKQ